MLANIIALIIVFIVVLVYMITYKIYEYKKYNFVSKCTKMRQPKKVTIKHNKKK